MSKLPQTDDLPHATPDVSDRYDPARVEAAFSAFADRVRELESVAGELKAELSALRAERSAPTRFDDERWPVERWPVESGANLSPDWIGAVPTPLARGFTVPRLALEGAFLLLVALCAGLADLSATWIVIVMVAAWALVALSEWAAAAKRARWRLDEIASALDPEAAQTTGPWDMPVVQATVVEAGSDPESQTIVTKLPAEPEPEPEPEAAVLEPAPEPEEAVQPEQAPKRRLGRWRRKQPAEAAAADPWEA